MINRFCFIIIFLCTSGCVNKNLNDFNYLSDSWSLECSSEGSFITENYFIATLRYFGKRSKRCEIASRHTLEFNHPFNLSFSVSSQNISNDDEWHSIFQIHSFPDIKLGEIWRCPVAALEVKNGNLRMFNRWDKNLLSVTDNGSCANKGNSISSRLLFDDFKLTDNVVYKIVIAGVLSYKGNGHLSVFINDKEVASFFGPNAYFDKRGPYLKLGIYKPTSWESKKSLTYIYRDISLEVFPIEN